MFTAGATPLTAAIDVPRSAVTIIA